MPPIEPTPTRNTDRRIVAALTARARPAPVAEGRIGLGDTAARLEDGRTGVACTFRAKLPRCQVALITATAILDHSIDALLLAARSCRLETVLGASTPLRPEAFAESCGMSQFAGHVRKVSLGVPGGPPGREVP